MLLELCTCSPGGMLVFFPSYGLLAKMMERWNRTGLVSEIQKFKTLFEEPKGSDGVEILEQTMSGYLNAIRAYDSWTPTDHHHENENTNKRRNSHQKVETMNGAMLLAVCRGKVSEGIDFSDDAARVVVLVGLPFPAYKDLKVVLKRTFQNDQIKETKRIAHENQLHLSLLAEEEKQGGFLIPTQDTASSSSSSSSSTSLSRSNIDNLKRNVILDGETWYKQQGYRALNQALGRCIRHKNDYGAIILADPRYGKKDVINHLSKWLRPSVRITEDLSQSIDELKQFFIENEKRRIKLINIDKINSNNHKKSNRKNNALTHKKKKELTQGLKENIGEISNQTTTSSSNKKSNLITNFFQTSIISIQEPSSSSSSSPPPQQQLTSSVSVDGFSNESVSMLPFQTRITEVGEETDNNNEDDEERDSLPRVYHSNKDEDGESERLDPVGMIMNEHTPKHEVTSGVENHLPPMTDMSDVHARKRIKPPTIQLSSDDDDDDDVDDEDDDDDEQLELILEVNEDDDDFEDNSFALSKNRRASMMMKKY